MEEKFIAAFAANREKAAALGVRMRPMDVDGFNDLAAKGQLKLSLEALAVDKRFTALFTDREADEALSRLLSAGYRF